MARDRVKERLTELSAINPATPDRVEQARRGLRDRSAMVVAKAATRVADLRLHDLVSELPGAFAKFCQDPIKSDPGCRAKLQIVRALEQLEWNDPALYLVGRRYTQMEPVWGGQEDTAAGVRGQCLAGLITMGYRQVLFEAVELLHDPAVEARRAAVREVGRLDSDAAELLLRMKVRGGDAELDVIGDCLTQLMATYGDHSMSFVAGFLTSPELGPTAALALAESRRPEAFPHLRGAMTHGPRELRKHLPLPIALLRTDESLNYLLELVVGADSECTVAVVMALKLFRGDQTTRERIDSVLRQTGNESLRRQFHTDDDD